MGKIQTILIALDLTVGFLVASTSLQAALTSTAVVSGSTTVVVAADPISYQGRLSDSGSPASGSYDFQFTLKDCHRAVENQPQRGGSNPASLRCLFDRVFEVEGQESVGGWIAG